MAIGPSRQSTATSPWAGWWAGKGNVNPWDAQFPTLTGSGSYTIRSKHFIRSLDGLEALAIAAWGPTRFSDGHFPTSRLAGQIAGNAFSAFAIGPILMGVVAGFGAACEDGGDADWKSSGRDASAMEVDEEDWGNDTDDLFGGDSCG